MLLAVVTVETGWCVNVYSFMVPTCLACVSVGGTGAVATIA